MAEKLIRFFGYIAAAQLVFALVVFAITRGTPVHAVMGMGIGLYLFWIIIGGLLMKKYRDPVRAFVENIRVSWQLKFILFSTALAMIEEVVTVAMTNTAPWYGVTMAQAHITASSNYWDVILTNSVVLFVPMFCIWAWLLSRYDFSPEAVFLLWGLSGTFLEMVTGGPQHILEIGMWMFVYGLMVYLPAYSIPRERSVKQPQWWHYLFSFAIVFLGIIPGGILAAIIKYIRPPHFFPGFN